MTVNPEAAPEALVSELRALGQRRALFFFDDTSGLLRCEQTELAPITEYLNGNRRDFGGHRAVFFELGAETGALMSAFLHKVERGQGAGGVRHWRYASTAELLNDGLRLARGMGRKNALAGLWWGGGKGIICQQEGAPLADEEYRTRLYRDYGRFISGLSGAYVTAEDVGTRPSDMAHIHETTRFLTCVPADVGGSGNPSQATARGVVCAMETAVRFAGLGSLAGKSIAMQGTGNVGSFMIEFLLQRGVARIVANDVSQASADRVRSEYAGAPLHVSVVDPADRTIFHEPCDVFAPNALGGVLNPSTIAELRCSVVCGAANNQLLDDQADDALLEQRGIVHVPDFVCNRMGIVNCANEQYGRLPNDPAIERHFDEGFENSIPRITEAVLGRARDTRTTPTRAANQLADELMLQQHPLWPGRTQQIIDALRAQRWERG